MAAQTSYSRLPSRAVAGMRADLSHIEVASRALSSAAGANAGVLIVEGSVPGSNGAIVTDAASVGAPVGFSMFEIAKEPTTPHFPQYSMVPCMRRGRIWLVCSGNISSNTEVLFIAHASGLPSVVDDATTTPLPAGYVLACLEGALDGQLGLFAVDFP